MPNCFADFYLEAPACKHLNAICYFFGGQVAGGTNDTNRIAFF